MRLKSLLINSLLSSFSIYIPLLAFSYYEYNFMSRFGVEKRFQDNNLGQRISAINSGYKPVFFPDKLISNKKIPPIYPIGSLPLTPTYYCNEGYGLITYETDRFGLRNSDAKWNTVNLQSNIFVIGDSFAHGACVPESSTISYILGTSTKQNTLNLATASNGPYEYQAILKSLIVPFIKNSPNSNKVIIIFYDNDNKPYQHKKAELLKSASFILEPAFEEGVKPTDNYKTNITKFIKENYPQTPEGMISKVKEKQKIPFKHSSFYYISTLHPIRLRVGLVNFQPSTSPTNNPTNSPSEDSISLLSEVCQSKCEPIVVYIPNSNYWRPNSDSSNYKKELKEISKKMGIKFIDGEDVIDKSNRKDYSPKGGHLSIGGYKKLADLIIKEI